MLPQVFKSRRFTRFSLRTLLVVFTAFSIWLGWQKKRASEQERAVNWILEHGGTVSYDSEHKPPLYLIRKPRLSAKPPAETGWLKSILGRHYFEHPVSVTLSKVSLDEEAIDHLCSLTKLHSLQLNESTFSQEDLDELHENLPDVHIVHPDCPLLGVSDGRNQQNQCLIGYVASNSAASRAEITGGDIILEYDGQQVRNILHLRHLISMSDFNLPQKIRIRKYMGETTVEIKLGTWKDHFPIH